jgi:hypothetical protein
MRTPFLFARIAPFGLLIACGETAPEPTGPSLSVQGVTASATGGGHFDAGVDVGFSFGVVQKGVGDDAQGHLRFSASLGGLQIEFHGEATCLAVDPVNARAWIGGVVTQNNSEHPAFTTDVHQPGKDIWFRTVDYGEGGNATQADRTTFVGFEGGGGIITSAEYCEKKIWPDEDARTGPVTEGNIQVGTR